MTTKYIRVKKDGFLYEYNDILAQHPGCEVITEEEAFPERFIPEHASKRVSKRKSMLNLATDNVPEPPDYASSELNEEATRGTS